MPAYLIAEVLGWNDFEQFAAKGDVVTDIVAKYGGRDIAYDNAVVLEGEYQPESILIIEFPSMEQLLACYHSEDYAPYKTLRQSCGRLNVLAVDGLHNEPTANDPQCS